LELISDYFRLLEVFLHDRKEVSVLFLLYMGRYSCGVDRSVRFFFIALIVIEIADVDLFGRFITLERTEIIIR
jgi:hypothetical protein